MTEKLTSWSFSRLLVYQDCPKKAYFRFIKRHPEPPVPALNRGTVIHTKLEHYLSKGRRIPSCIHPDLVDEYKRIRKLRPIVEQDLAFTDKWMRVPWESPLAWVRLKMDVMIPPTAKDKTIYIDDHKTGKFYHTDKYMNQLEFYSMVALMMYPEAEQAKARLLFVDHGRIIPAMPVLRADLPGLKKKWQAKVRPMMDDVHFIEKPSFESCKFCTFKQAEGGPCIY